MCLRDLRCRCFSLYLYGFHGFPFHGFTGTHSWFTYLNRATEQMTTYKPAEHEGTTSVAPLLQFFELVHIGDTMQSMVQVYFDRELVCHLCPVFPFLVPNKQTKFIFIFVGGTD